METQTLVVLIVAASVVALAVLAVVVRTRKQPSTQHALPDDRHSSLDVDWLGRSDDYNIEWTPPLDSHFAEKEYTARFYVDGDLYFVGFDKRKKGKEVIDYYLVWDLDRSVQRWWWTIKGWFNGQVIPGTRTTKFNEKGLGYTLKVIRGVFNCIHDFMVAKHPDIIEYDTLNPDEAFSAELKTFHDRASIHFARKLGYAAHHNMLLREECLRRPAVMALISKPLEVDHKKNSFPDDHSEH